MNVIVVDTSAWIAYFSGQKPGRYDKDLDSALKEGRVYLSPIVAAEILSGRNSSSQKDKLIDLLRELPLCDQSLEHWTRVGELRAFCSSKGLAVSTPDAHIAQCSLDLDGYLMSEDTIFRRIHKIRTLRLL